MFRIAFGARRALLSVSPKVLQLSAAIACSATLIGTEAARADDGAPTLGGDAPACTAEFLGAYKMVAVEFNTVVRYAKAKEMPPNLPRSAQVCANFENQFPEASPVNCQMGNQTLSNLEIAHVCRTIRSVAASAGLKLPTSTPLPAGAATDASKLIDLSQTGVVAVVNDAAALQAALTQPKLVYFVEGQVLDFKQALASRAPVRCTVSLSPLEPVQLPQATESLRSATTDETFVSNSYTDRIIWQTGGWALQCSKHSPRGDDGSEMTLGDLKRAMGPARTFGYQP